MSEEDSETGYFGDLQDLIPSHSTSSYPPHHGRAWLMHFPHAFLKRHKEEKINAPLLDDEPEMTFFHRHDLQTVYEGKRTTCNQDNEMMADSESDDHSEVGGHECGICGKVYKSEFSLTRHATVHQPHHEFKCCVCKKEYSNKYTYKEHMKLHNTDKNICPTCGKSFSTAYWLNRHEETIHGKSEAAVFKCQECGKACSCKAVLNAHIAKHGNDAKKFSCFKCEREFLYKTSQLRHERTCKPEEKKRSFECPVCRKSFQVARFLKQHSRVHMPPTYTCQVCGKAFRWRTCLSKHMKSCLVEKE